MGWSAKGKGIISYLGVSYVVKGLYKHCVYTKCEKV
jgi:hypothetical protein